MIYLITYDLRSTDKDYDPLFLYLESNLGTDSLHIMKDSWLVSCECKFNISELCDKLRAFVEDKDLIFISLVEKSKFNGLLPSTSWN